MWVCSDMWIWLCMLIVTSGHLAALQHCSIHTFSQGIAALINIQRALLPIIWAICNFIGTSTALFFSFAVFVCLLHKLHGLLKLLWAAMIMKWKFKATLWHCGGEMSENQKKKKGLVLLMMWTYIGASKCRELLTELMMSCSWAVFRKPNKYWRQLDPNAIS